MFERLKQRMIEARLEAWLKTFSKGNWNMKGYRTLLFNAGAAGLVAILTWAGGVNWAEHVSPTVAMVIMAVVNVGLRWLTDTPIGKSKP